MIVTDEDSSRRSNSIVEFGPTDDGLVAAKGVAEILQIFAAAIVIGAANFALDAGQGVKLGFGPAEP